MTTKSGKAEKDEKVMGSLTVSKVWDPVRQFLHEEREESPQWNGTGSRGLGGYVDLF